MAVVNLSVRYFQDSTPADVPCREESFLRRQVEMALPVEETALVLVDLWNTHFIETWLERAVRVTNEEVVPAIEAARVAGLTIVQAPSPEIAAKYEQLQRHVAAAPVAEPDWPPAQFRAREGEYAAFRGPRSQPPGIAGHWEAHKGKLDMSSAIDVREGDSVIATGDQLHELARQRGIVHLIYAGFATNWCILNRDYGMRAISRHGYNMILLRDATMGVEYPDTVDECFATEMAIREVETQIGFTASNEDFLAACRRAGGA